MFRENTGMFELYINLGYPPIGKGGILLPMDQILENLNDGSNLWGLEEDERSKNASRYYIRLQSVEGGESWYYHTKSDRIYLCEWGNEKLMISSQLKPAFSSSYEFVNWMYDDEYTDTILSGI